MALVPKQTSAYNISNSSTFTKSLSRYGEGPVGAAGRMHWLQQDASPWAPLQQGFAKTGNGHIKNHHLDTWPFPQLGDCTFSPTVHTHT